MRSRHAVSFALGLVILMLPAVSSAENDCSAEIAEIDRRIATGKYPARNVQVAEQMKKALGEMCAIMDDASRAAMMESIEDLLPTRSEEEKNAERRARSKQLEAEREARKKREAAEAQAREQLVSPVVRAAPTAVSVATALLERDEPMMHTFAWDWEIHHGNLRLLYASAPDRTQFGLPDWSTNVYVAQMTPDGKVTHTHITGKQASDQKALALRRGHDELYYLRQAGRPPEPVSLERWSIPEARLVASVDVTALEWNAGGRAWRDPSFQVATSDGNLLFAGIAGGGRQDRQVRLAWFELSPQGKILSSDVYGIADSSSPWGWFRTGNGGGGLVVDVSPVDGVDLASGPTLPADAARLGDELTAHVSREKRLLIVGTDGGPSVRSIVIERDLFQQAAPQTAKRTTPTDPSAIAQKIQRQQAWIDDLQAAHEANRSTVYLDVGLRRVEMVKEAPDGIAVLTRVTAHRNRKPPIHGPYVLVFDAQGRTKSEIYLQQLEEDLDVRFKSFAPAPQGGFYLHAPDRRQIVLVDPTGKPLARSETQGQAVKEEGIVADAEGVWVFGHSYGDAGVSRVYLERIRFVGVES